MSPGANGRARITAPLDEDRRASGAITWLRARQARSLPASSAVVRRAIFDHQAPWRHAVATWTVAPSDANILEVGESASNGWRCDEAGTWRLGERALVYTLPASPPFSAWSGTAHLGRFWTLAEAMRVAEESSKAASGG